MINKLFFKIIKNNLTKNFFNPNSLLRNFTTKTKELKEDKPHAKTVKKAIKISPRKLTPVANLVSGLTVPEALKQLEFSPKRIAPIVAKTIQNATNLADIRYTIEPEKLIVSTAMVGRGQYLKRIRFKSKGRHGIMHRRHSHLTIEVEEQESIPKSITPHKKRVIRDQNRLRALIKEREESSKPKIEFKDK